jgi:hypothetical protein
MNCDFSRSLSTSWLVLLWLLVSPADLRAAADRLEFRRDVLPILSDKCFRCHGPDEATREGGLRLDLPTAITEPADSGQPALVPGEPESSELVRRILSEDEFEQMPPPETKQPLTDDEKQRLIQWIRTGAVYERHWSWEPIRRSPLPAVERADWPIQPIDHFVLERLEREGLAPSPVADPYRLIRRVTLDLTGIPPTPEEVDRFVADDSPPAYDALVDRLLASPAFGERMAWSWLDGARYADSNGYQGDGERTMWPWRDWVVSALNRNLPFDDFTIWQLGGDLLPEATFEQRLATGYLRNHMINGEGGRIPEENRVEYVMDMTETVGTVWLGLTLNCCRCHDHKYDQLSQEDYYALFDFFNQTPVDGSGGNPQTPPVLEVPSPAQRQRRDQLASAVRELAEQIRGEEETLRKLLERSPDQRPPEPLRELETFLTEKSAGLAEQVRQLREWKEQQAALNRSIPRVMVMQDQAERRETFLLNTGLYSRPERQVVARVPASLPSLGDVEQPNRLDLARWLLHDDQPLTARVVVNRVWQEFFGVGLVKTSEDFGTQGEIPSHPELLEWLADELVRSGWDWKHICRLIVTSATYRQSSRVTDDLWQRDPQNRLLARGPRYRLPSWMVRDQALAAGGLLVRQIGGPPVHPYQPEGVWEEATFGRKSYPRDQGEDLYRRSLYTFWRRIVGPTMFFDSAPRQVCVVNPSRTNTPLHALTTLNDTTYVEAGRALAERVLESAGPDATPDTLAVAAFRLVLARPPEGVERDVLVASLRRLEQQFGASPEAAEQFLSVGDSTWNRRFDPIRLAALAACATCHPEPRRGS